MYIYVAGPYTKNDVILNIRRAIEVGDTLRNMGHVPFIPHMTYAWHMQYPHDIEFWYKYDLEWLKKCDALFRIAGESKGADDEETLARKLGMPVFYDYKEVVKYRFGRFFKLDIEKENK